MIEDRVAGCCTARLWRNFPVDIFFTKNIKKELDETIKQLLVTNKKSNTKIISVYLTDKQTESMKILKNNDFKRAGMSNSRVDAHNTKLYLYYYIFTGK